MSNNQDFPGLGGETDNSNQAPDTWDQDIPKQDKPKKEKKKLKLGGGANLNTGAAEFQFDPSSMNFGGQPQMDFGFQPQQQAGFDFLQQPQQQDPFGFQPQQQDPFGMFPPQQQQDPYYTYPDPSQGYAENIIQDQNGNLFELEEGQYIEDGQIWYYEQEPEDQSQQFWDNYQNKNQTTTVNKTQQQQKQQQQVKKDTKKKAAKKDTKKAPAPQQPKRIRRLEKLAQQSDAQKQEESLGPIKKQERFSIQDLQKKEEPKLQEGDKFTKVDIAKDSLNLVFIGHVDAGKSTLSGRVLMDAGEIDDKTIKQFEIEAKKNNREGWFFAYAMDINEDERNKGKTVETGKAFFQLSQRRFTLLDAPGHKNYVPNMISGACQSDIACLIISSKQGEFESGFEKGGQTMEHVQLIRALGVQQLCIVVSKMDTNNWSEERYKYIVDQVKPWLKDQCGYENVPFIPINAFDGQNISGRVDPGICSWYEGLSLFEFLNTANVPKRDSAGGVKIPVLDVQKEEGKQFIYGKVESGVIFDDIWVTCMPYRKTFQITEIYDAKDRRLYYAPPGENVKFKIKGNLNEDDIQRGFMICSTDELCGVSTEFQAEIQLLELPGNKQILSSGYTCIIHTHTAVQEVEISEIKAVYDKSHSKMIAANILKNGEKGIVNLTTDSYLCLEKFENTPILGRFTLRDENVTIAFGTIKKYKPSFEFLRTQAKKQQAK